MAHGPGHLEQQQPAQPSRLIGPHAHADAPNTGAARHHNRRTPDDKKGVSHGSGRSALSSPNARLQKRDISSPKRKRLERTRRGAKESSYLRYLAITAVETAAGECDGGIPAANEDTRNPSASRGTGRRSRPGHVGQAARVSRSPLAHQADPLEASHSARSVAAPRRRA